MKKFQFLSGLLSVLFLLSVFQISCFAQTDSFSWYCVHVKDHKRPAADAELSFVQELDGFYLDPNVSETSDEKVIYLTFDAGYENGNVSKVLDVLKEENVPGSFFILEHLIQKNPELVKRMVAEGHLVANHTARHKDMSKADNSTLLKELETLEKQYYDLTGQEMPKFYRPPEGRFSRSNLECLKENGYKTIFWSFAYPDWDNQRQMPPEKATKIILENLHNGEIMLLHPTSATNASILKNVIRELKSQGYRFAKVDELVYHDLQKGQE